MLPCRRLRPTLFTLSFRLSLSLLYQCMLSCLFSCLFRFWSSQLAIYNKRALCPFTFYIFTWMRGPMACSRLFWHQIHDKVQESHAHAHARTRTHTHAHARTHTRTHTPIRGLHPPRCSFHLAGRGAHVPITFYFTESPMEPHKASPASSTALFACVCGHLCGISGISGISAISAISAIGVIKPSTDAPDARDGLASQ